VHTNYRHVLEKIVVDHRKVFSPENATAEEIAEIENSDILISRTEPESELVWTPDNDNLILSKYSEGNSYERTQAEFRGQPETEKQVKEMKVAEDKKVAAVQAMVGESVQKLGNALKESAEAGKAFLHNVKDLMEKSKNFLDQAKSLAGVVLESAPKKGK